MESQRKQNQMESNSQHCGNNPLHVNIKTLTRLRSLLKPANAATLDHFAAARTTPLPKRFYLLWKSGVYRQSMFENIGLYLGCLFGRL